MSAETIPNELVDILRGEIGAAIDVSEDGTAMSDPNFEPAVEDVVQAVIRVLASRSTRPAEPAAPVAEAGDGETYYTKGKDADWFEGLSHQDAAWALTCAAMDLNDTGLGDHVDLFMPHNAMLSGAGDRIKNLCSTLEAERARADAAEQRAADALARAEKAEEALETAQSHLTAIFGIETHLLHVGYDEGPGGGNFVYAEVIRTDDLAFIAARAPREAQPATDGGDNG